MILKKENGCQVTGLAAVTTIEGRRANLICMATLEDIENAVAELPPEQLRKFRAWFAAFEGARFDQALERDAGTGRLDWLAEKALRDRLRSRGKAAPSVPPAEAVRAERERE